MEGYLIHFFLVFFVPLPSRFNNATMLGYLTLMFIVLTQAEYVVEDCPAKPPCTCNMEYKRVCISAKIYMLKPWKSKCFFLN